MLAWNFRLKAVETRLADDATAKDEVRYRRCQLPELVSSQDELLYAIGCISLYQPALHFQFVLTQCYPQVAILG